MGCARQVSGAGFFLFGVLSCWFLGFWFGFFIVEGVVLFFWVCFFFK